VLRAGQQARLFAPPPQPNALVRALENQVNQSEAQLREAQRVIDEERARSRESTYSMNQTLDKAERAREIDKEAAGNVVKELGTKVARLDMRIEKQQNMIGGLVKSLKETVASSRHLLELFTDQALAINQCKNELTRCRDDEADAKAQRDKMWEDALKSAREQRVLKEQKEALKRRVAELEQMVARQESFVQNMLPSRAEE
jgi:DNA-directed RNA polymerase subunit F